MIYPLKELGEILVVELRKFIASHVERIWSEQSGCEVGTTMWIKDVGKVGIFPDFTKFLIFEVGLEVSLYSRQNCHTPRDSDIDLRLK